MLFRSKIHEQIRHLALRLAPTAHLCHRLCQQSGDRQRAHPDRIDGQEQEAAVGVEQPAAGGDQRGILPLIARDFDQAWASCDLILLDPPFDAKLY